MTAVRFPDMQGKLLCMAICSCFCIPPPKRLPRLPPAGGTLSFAFIPKMRAVAGEGLAGGGLEGCASPEEANPSKVFSDGGNLNRRVSPRSFPSANSYPGMKKVPIRGHFFISWRTAARGEQPSGRTSFFPSYGGRGSGSRQPSGPDGTRRPLRPARGQARDGWRLPGRKCRRP